MFIFFSIEICIDFKSSKIYIEKDMVYSGIRNAETEIRFIPVSHSAVYWL